MTHPSKLCWPTLVCLSVVGLIATARPAMADDAIALEARVRAVAAKCVANTVGLVHASSDGSMASLSSGSGVIVTADGLILTAGHVIDKPGTSLTVRLNDGRTFHGTAVGLDHLTDTGVARITDPAPPGGWPFSPMAPADSVHPGDWLLATGNAGSIVVDRDPPLRLGRATVCEPGLLRTNCALEPGDSGGPVYDLSGRVVGINSRIAAGGPTEATKEYISLHTPVGAFDAEWSSLLAGMNGHPDVNLDTSGPRRRRPPMGQMWRFRRALAKLVAANDPEAIQLLADSREDNSRLALPPDRMDQLIRRADALGATTRPTTRPVAAVRPTTRPTVAATVPPQQRGIPADLRPRLREQLRANILRQFPTAKVTDALLDRIMDRSTFDADDRQMRLRPEPEDLRAMGLSDEVITAVASANPAAAGRSTVAWGKTSLQTLSLFAPAMAATGDCVAEVRSASGATVLMGTVVAADGWVVTKASDLPDRPTVVLPNGRSLVAKVIGEDRATDLALLKVDAEGLAAARFTGPAPVGEFVFCPTLDANQPAIGVVSVAARPIGVEAPAFVGERRIVLGVEFAGDTGLIAHVTPGMPAAVAGMRAGDRIVALNGRPVSDASDVISQMKEVRPGQTVTLGLRRADKSIDVKPVIGAARATTQTIDSLGQTDRYAGGKLSRRRSDFPQAIETDAAIWADQCGGPLFNLRGEAIGVTIARYDRVCTFALPAELVRHTVNQLRAAAKM